LAAIRQQTLCLNAVSKAHLRRDQLREWRDRWIRVVGAPVMRGTDRRHISGGSRERRMRRLRNGQLYSARLARVRIEALLGVRGPPSSDVSKDGSYGTEVTDHPLGFALASQLGFRVPYGSPEFGCSFASKSDKGSVGSVPVGGRLAIQSVPLLHADSSLRCNGPLHSSPI
jgi:hypothetical protein